MRALEPHTRFLLRGSALLIGLLTLWWFALLGPMLFLLKGAAGAFVRIEETPARDWTLRAGRNRSSEFVALPDVLASPAGVFRDARALALLVGLDNCSVGQPTWSDGRNYRSDNR
jgi:hypothetical protein